MHTQIRWHTLGIANRIEQLASSNTVAIKSSIDPHEWTYKRLNSIAATIAKSIADMTERLRRSRTSCRQRLRIAVSVDRSPLMVACQVAVWQSNACLVVISTSHPLERRNELMALSGADLSISCSSIQDTDSVTVNIIEPSVVDEGDNRMVDNDPHDLLYISFTSGTTGVPKGVMVREKGVLSLFESLATILAPHLPKTHPFVFLAVSPEYFDISFFEVFFTLMQAATLVLHVSSASPLIADVTRYKPDILQATPSAWQLLIAAGWSPSRTGPALRLVGGEVFPSSLARQLLPGSALLLNLYGPTETTIWVSSFTVTDDALLVGEPSVPLGKPLGENCFEVDETWQDTTDSVMKSAPLTGELVVRGVNVATGYSSPRGTQTVFSGVYRTGDIVTVTESTHQRLYFRKRKDTQVKIRGNRIELGELEALALSFPGVAQARAVVQKTDPDELNLASALSSVEDLLVLFVLPAEVVSPSHLCNDLLKYIRKKVPGYMQPQIIRHLSSFPVTGAGKIATASMFPRVNLFEDTERLSNSGYNSAPAEVPSLEGLVQLHVSSVLRGTTDAEIELCPLSDELHLDSISVVILCKMLSRSFENIWCVDSTLFHPIEDGIPIVLSSKTLSHLAHKLFKTLQASTKTSVAPLVLRQREKSSSNSATRVLPQTQGKKDLPPLAQACRDGDLEGVERILASARNQSATGIVLLLEESDRFGSTAFHYAAGGGFVDICRLLVSSGVSHTSADRKSGRTALHWAARQGHTRVSEYLICELHHNLEVRAKDDTTPIQLAAWGGHIDTCQWLIQHGASITFVNRWGCTAMHFAALAGELATCKWLHATGLDLAHVNYQGHHTLHKAAYGGHRKLCEWLLEDVGMYPHTSDVRGQQPCDLARKAGFNELAHWLASQS